MVSAATITTYFNDFGITVHWDGTKPSPMDPENKNCHAITVRNALVGTQATVLTWRPRIKTQEEALYAFYCILQGCMFGAMEPAHFCHFLEINPESPEAEKYYLHFREVAAKLSQVIAHRDELAKTLRMLAQKLGPKGNTNAKS